MAYDLANHIQGSELERRLLRFALQNKRDPLRSGSDDLGQWFTTVEQACTHCGVPASQYVDAALLLIHDGDPLLGIMRDRRDIYRGRNGQEYWPWQMFKADVETVVHARQDARWRIGTKIAMALVSPALIQPVLGEKAFACVWLFLILVMIIDERDQVGIPPVGVQDVIQRRENVENVPLRIAAGDEA